MKRVLLVLLGTGACGPVPTTAPELAAPAAVMYPEELWDAGAEGTTTLRLFVHADGSADSAQVSKSSGYPALDEAALQGVASLRFKAARQRERTVGTWVQLPVHFRLQPAPHGRHENS